jgi:hypothetical protein
MPVSGRLGALVLALPSVLKKIPAALRLYDLDCPDDAWIKAAFLRT